MAKKKTELEKLQARAEKLNLPFEGVSEEDLKLQVEEAEAAAQPAVEEAVESGGANTAIVRKEDGNEVRRYTLEDHGEDFAKLAKGFAAKQGFVVELKEVLPAVVCPQCGARIYQDIS